MTMTTKTKRVPKNEPRCTLHLRLRNGLSPIWHRGEGKTKAEVGIGLTDSERGLGFVIDGTTEFVLDRKQVENLAGFLLYQAQRMKKGGNLPDWAGIWPAAVQQLPPVQPKPRHRKP
jgi:hypothetical protein